MAAAYIEELGPADHIRYGELPVPRPGPTDVLVAVEAVSVNHVDTFVRSGAYPTPTPFPFVIGRDLVGTVVDRGAGVDAFAVGQRVWSNSLGHDGRQGAASQYAVVAVDRLYRLPDGVDPVTAVAVVHPAATAHLGLFREAATRVGETVLVGGGAGNVGTAAIELAAAAGARVLASARPRDFDHCRAAGADAVVDYRAADLTDQVRALAPAGVDVHWDTSGHHDLDAAVAMLAHGGRIVLAAGMDARPALPVGDLYTRDGRLVGFAISNAGVDDLSAAADAINTLLPEGRISARIEDVLPLSAAQTAHRRIEAGDLAGRRLVLLP